MADESNPNPNAGAGGQAGGNVNVQNGAPQGHVTTEDTKIAHVVTQLDNSTVDQVLDILRAPQAQAQFVIGHVTAEDTKFAHVVTQLSR